MINSLQGVLDKSHLLDGGSGLWKKHPSLSRLFQRFTADYDKFRSLAESCVDSALKGQKKDSLMTKLKMDHECDEETLRALAEDLLFAGIDTSSHLVAFSLYFLAKNQRVQSNLLDEVKTRSFAKPGK